MRTKHILTALALPAVFAACTADEFDSVNINNGDATQARPTVGENFTLNTSNADTRYAAEEGASGIRLNFTEGDRLGAAIIDNYDPEAESPYDFKVIYSLAGNNPFKFQGGDQWTSDTELGIGHYLFKFPYNPADNNRAAATFELPTVQKLYTNENGELDLTAAIEAGNMAVAATVLTEGQTNADVSLKNLFTYPKVQINFDNGEKVNTVSQVVLEYAEEITVKGGFDHKVVANLFADEPTDLEDKDYWDGETKSIIWDEVETSDFLLAEDGDGADFNPYKDENERKSKYIVVKFPKNTQVKLDSNTKNKYVEARFMLPSVEDFNEYDVEEGEEEEEKLTMYVYTDNGVYEAPFKPESFIFKGTTTDETINGALGRGKGYNLTLDKASLTKSNEQNIVTTVEDWNGLVEAYGSSKNPVMVAIVGDEFAFDSNTKFPSVSTFEVGTDVNVKGNVEIRNVDLGTNTINVLEGAALTVNNTLVAEKIVNEGTVNVIAKADKDKNAYNGVQTIDNEATLNVAAGADAKFVLHNEKGAKVAVAEGGKMSVAGYNNGTIDVNGIMWTVNEVMGFENKEIEERGEVILNTPTINIYKDAQVVANFGTLTNNGLVVNEGEFTCQSNAGTIVNKEELQSKEGAVSYITANNGKVVVEVANPTTLTINNENKGIVEYTTGKSSEDFTGSDVNTVIATGNYEVRGGNLATLTLKGTGTLKVNASAEIGELDVDGNITLGENVKVGVDGLNIAEGAMINIPKGTELTVNTAEYENLGRILVGGTLEAKKVSQSVRGDVNNDGGQITWKEDADKDDAMKVAKANYENALVDAITHFASNSIEGKYTVNNLNYDIINGKKGEQTADQLFVEYVAANQSVDAIKTLGTALATYQGYDPTITLTTGYSDAAAKVIADNEAKVEELDLAWTVSSYGTAEEAHIYTSEELAKDAFKAAVVSGEVLVSSTLQKVVICSSEKNFIPEGSYVLTTDEIYKMFDIIDDCNDDDGWKSLGFTYQYGKTSDWSLKLAKNWISDVRQSSKTAMLVQDARDFITTNGIVDKSKTWKYQDNLIKGIANQYWK